MFQDDQTLEQIHYAVCKQLDKIGGDPMKLSVHQRTFLLVYSAQGTIDNGGFQYFFESDFPHNPPYSAFIDAFRNIGASATADALEQAVAMFDFADPHLDLSKRNAFMNARRVGDEGVFHKIDCTCGDERNYELLFAYYHKHKLSFPGGLFFSKCWWISPRRK